MEQKSKNNKNGYFLLDLRRSIKNPLTDNNIIKIDIFAAKIFLKTKITDFNNNKIKVTIEQKALNISLIILTEKISKLIKTLLNGKTLKPNGIPNMLWTS